MITKNEFAELVRASRTFRRFDEAVPVSREQLLELVDVARFASCGNNLQVLRFKLMTNADEVATCFAHHKWAGLLKDWDGPAAGERPTAYVAICGKTGADKSAIRNQDAGIAAQTIMLAARAMGLGGCMIKSYDKGLDEDLGLVELGYETLLLLALGVPTEKVVLEDADEEHGVAYWHDELDVNHVPKRSVEDLLL